MDWLKLALLVITSIGKLAAWARERQLLDAGAQRQIAAAMMAEAIDILEANRVRKDQRHRNAAVTGELPDDGFRRPD